MRGRGEESPPALGLASEVYRAWQTLRSAWHVDGYAVIDGLQGTSYTYLALQLWMGCCQDTEISGEREI